MFPTSSCGSALQLASDQLVTFLGRKQVADRFELFQTKLVANRFAAGFRPAFDQPATRTRHAHAGLRPGRRPGLRLDNAMEFGLKQQSRLNSSARNLDMSNSNLMTLILSSAS